MKHVSCIQIKYVKKKKNGGSLSFFLFSFSKHPYKYLALPDRKPLKTQLFRLPIPASPAVGTRTQPVAAPSQQMPSQGGGVEWVHTIAQLCLTKNLA